MTETRVCVLSACHPDIFREAVATVRSTWPDARVLAVCLLDCFQPCTDGRWADDVTLVREYESLMAARERTRAFDADHTVLVYRGGGSGYLKMVLCAPLLTRGEAHVTGRRDDLVSWRWPAAALGELTGWWLPYGLAPGLEVRRDRRQAAGPAQTELSWGWAQALGRGVGRLARLLVYPFLLLALAVRAASIVAAARARLQRDRAAAASEAG